MKIPTLFRRNDKGIITREYSIDLSKLDNCLSELKRTEKQL